MNILVLNTGSSSLKYRLFAMPSARSLAHGLVERIGEPSSRIRHVTVARDGHEAEQKIGRPIGNHEQALRLVAELLSHRRDGVVDGPDGIDAIGHRIVHGGESFSDPVLIDGRVITMIAANAPLAPLHNPAGLTGIKVARELFPGVPMIAVFDTAFHQTMEPEAYLYGLPMELYERHKVRRYGFHGTSHRYVSRACARLLRRDPARTSLITAHLGNGCSMAAIRNGRCIETSMGLTPLAGLLMGTRCGDIDPALHAYIAREADLDLDEIDALLNTQSGLKGICGDSDMRDIHARRERGDRAAELAFRMFTRRVRHYIGAYLAQLGRCRAIVFTAGIGENDHHVRREVCRGLEPLGATLDPVRNRELRRGAPCRISTDGSDIALFVIPTNEELEIALQTASLMNAAATAA